MPHNIRPAQSTLETIAPCNGARPRAVAPLAEGLVAAPPRQLTFSTGASGTTGVVMLPARLAPI